jgi:hypothetical protein
MTVSDWITIAAIILAPIVALQISALIENRRNKYLGRLHCFRTLMGTRASRLSLEHTNALNMIDVAFYGRSRKFKKVVGAWKSYLDHLEDKQLRDASIEGWGSKGNDLFIDLMINMAESLGLEYERVALKRTAYSPVAHGQIEEDMSNIRKGLSDLFSGKTFIPITVLPTDTKEKQDQLREMIENYLLAKTPLKVIILNDEENRSNIEKSNNQISGEIKK